MKKYFKILPLIFLATLSFAGTDGTIRGKIVDEEGNALPGAQVFIQGTSIGTMCDLDGNYILLNVQVGTYDVTISMIGYKTKVVKDVNVVMDQTKWLNAELPIAAIEGDVVFVTVEKELVEKGSTSKKITMGSEAIEALPIRDVTELYDLQSGVVKMESGQQGGVPDAEERGLQEVHVRGGRTGEIAYMIDGMYIRNPIFGGIGSGTRLNIFAIKEFDFQPGGFNSEYGDAMSAVSNYHTMKGGEDFKYKLKYESSSVGAALGNEFDELRGYNDFNLGFGGTLPFVGLKYWFSGQHTTRDNYAVFEFDDLYYREGDPNNDNNRAAMVWPWDDEPGFRGFGFDKTWDVFGNLTYDITDKLRVNLSYWQVENHRKSFNYSGRYLYWDEGQNEIFRDTYRYAFEVNHSLTQSTFYTLRASTFTQDQFIGSRWQDSDSDGYPDWFEWKHAAGEMDNSPFGSAGLSDPYNADVIPYIYSENGDSIRYTNRDGLGPNYYASGWYYGAEPGNYNWDVAEQWTDRNYNGVWDEGEPWEDANGDNRWNGPSLVEGCYYRDGSYWITPEMYVDFEDFYDEAKFYIDRNTDPYNAASDESSVFAPDSLYFLTESAFGRGTWSEGRAFGGHDVFYSTSTAITNEVRFDLTSQLTNEWKIRTGIDLKSHKLNFYEVKNAWDGVSAVRQRFAEQWDDYGVDGVLAIDSDEGVSDFGEGNGQWDKGESFDDFNGNGKWDDYVEPLEISGYIQNTFEVPWMVINAGARIDVVNYNTKLWSEPFVPGNEDDAVLSAERPWFWSDCGRDKLCPGDIGYTGVDSDGSEGTGSYEANGNGQYDFGEDFTDCYTYAGSTVCEDMPGWNPDQFNADGANYISDEDEYNELGIGQWNDGEAYIDSGEETGDQFGMPKSKVFFVDSDWQYRISPRIGISHVITDDATFTFNYGVYYQTPIYENVYRNTNRQEDPEELFEQADGLVGNASMSSQRTKSYEFAFNFKVGNYWGFQVGAWVKDMDQLVTSRFYRSGIYDYQVASNGDFGRANGLDFTVQNRGLLVNTVIQYTLMSAKANGDQVQASPVYVDTPAQEYTMPFDRTHDLTVSLYGPIPFINAIWGLTGFYQSGFPYTPYIEDGSKWKEDPYNLYGKRSEAYKKINVSLSKAVEYKDFSISLGLNVLNLYSTDNHLAVWPITGDAYDPGTYYTDEIDLPANEGSVSRSYYDMPWRVSTPREINFFIQMDFK